MTKENQDLYLQFLREISEGDGDLNRLEDSLTGVAYIYHLSGLEAEFLGYDDSDRKVITLYGSEDKDPVGEPVKCILESEMIPSIAVYAYAAENPFTEDEKEELEMYSTVCGLVLQKFKIAGMIG